MRFALARRTAHSGLAGRPSSSAPTPFISVAFVAAIFFVPLVIMTGLMTEPGREDGALPDLGVSAMRGTIDAPVADLRPSQD